MSFLIKDMEMPDIEHGVRTINIYADGVVTNYAEEIIGEAVTVPPHGRLIDERWLKDAITITLEALKKNPKMDNQETHLIAAFDTLRAMVEAAPTIIPAEEGET